MIGGFGRGTDKGQHAGPQSPFSLWGVGAVRWHTIRPYPWEVGGVESGPMEKVRDLDMRVVRRECDGEPDQLRVTISLIAANTTGTLLGDYITLWDGVLMSDQADDFVRSTVSAWRFSLERSPGIAKEAAMQGVI